jgi:tetratricopeptide (TPR) repeat protein
MPADFPFRITIPKEPNGKLVSAEEAEKLLLEKLKKYEHELESTIWDLAIFYSRTNRQTIAMQFIDRLMASTDDPERKALYYLKMGQFMEQIRNYDSAIVYYLHAFSLEPVNNETWYFINNNLGYCLNFFGRHQEAEPYCRDAIKIDPQKYNAYKNLGVSLEGQGQYTEAAKLYIKAVQVNAADPRALVHLEKLFAKHNEILLDMPNIQAQIEKCKEAINFAQKLQRRFEDGFKKKAKD